MTLREYKTWIDYLIDKSPESLDLEVVFQISTNHGHITNNTNDVDFVQYAPIIHNIDTDQMKLTNKNDRAVLKIVLLN